MIFVLCFTGFGHFRQQWLISRKGTSKEIFGHLRWVLVAAIYNLMNQNFSNVMEESSFRFMLQLRVALGNERSCCPCIFGRPSMHKCFRFQQEWCRRVFHEEARKANCRRRWYFRRVSWSSLLQRYGWWPDVQALSSNDKDSYLSKHSHEIF